MRIIRLKELRKIHSEIQEKNAVSDPMDIQNKETILYETVKKIVELAYIARREGLLALEDAVWDIALESAEEVLKHLIIMVVDGTEPQIVEEIGLSRYYAHLYTDYEALRYLMYLEGALSIQAGENPRILEERLKVMLPANMYLTYCVNLEKANEEKEREKKEHLIEDLCKGKRNWTQEDSGYYVYKLLDYVICDITDNGLQRVMREIENVTLSLAMKGMSGEARRRIFANLSNRLAILIAEDMVSMYLVRAVDILEASQKILNVIIRLSDTGEIIGNYEYLEPFYDVFRVDTNQQRTKNRKIAQLKQMVEEYEQGDELVQEVTE
ncbi:MAG: hypothetical protein IKJ01_05760 [Lachnospiraceae bacterium]|nr:hypothetical protein [Lachnospiraceae bacterium]